MGGELQNIKFQAPNWGPAQRVGTPKGKLQTNPKFQYLITKTVLEFGILVIVIWIFRHSGSLIQRDSSQSLAALVSPPLWLSL